jgi:hypothetical protein
VASRETYQEGSAICRGYEGSPQGRRRYRTCMNYFTYKMTLEYKTDNKTQ